MVNQGSIRKRRRELRRKLGGLNINQVTEANSELEDHLVYLRAADFIHLVNYGPPGWEEAIRGVRWKGLADYRDNENRKLDFNSVNDTLLGILVENDVLTDDYREGVYMIVGEGVSGANVGPVDSQGIIYNFTERSQKIAVDYQNYAPLFHGEGIKPVYLAEIGLS